MDTETSVFFCLAPSSRFQTMPNGSLVIRDVTTDDTGKYTCVAGNSCSIKDRVAQLYVVGEFGTLVHTCIHRLCFIRSKWAQNHKCRVKALIKPSASVCHPCGQVNNHRRVSDATAVTEVMGSGRRWI